MADIRPGVLVDLDTVIEAEKVLRRALENGNEPEAVVFHEHPEELTPTRTFSLAYGSEDETSEVADAE